MRWIVLLLCIFSLFQLEGSSNKQSVVDQRENYFQTSTPNKILPNVSPITGDLIEEEVDLVVAGCEPLSVRRFYNHSAPYEPRSGGWRYNPEAFFVANFECKAQETFAAAGSHDGSITSFKPSANICYFNPESFINLNPSGQTHPLNTKINYYRARSKEKGYFSYRGEIIDGTGAKRTFDSGTHCWLSNMTTDVRRKGSNLSLTMYTPNCWTPYQLHVTEERRPNGNIICYSITTWKDNKIYRRPHLLSGITAYNADKTKVLGSISFGYNKDKHEDVRGITAKGSDGRKISFQHQGNSPILLTSAMRANQTSMRYSYQGQCINRIEKPDGRVITTEYNAAGKVAAQYAPIGPSGEMHPIGRYIYHKGATEIYDAEGHKTIYRFNDNNQILSLETYQNDTLYRVDRFNWDSNGNLLKKTTEDGASNVLQITEYKYDKNHNPIEEKTGNGKEWHTIYRTFSDDSFNLKLTESDCPGRIIHYAYLAGTNLLTSELLYEGNSIRKRIFNTYDNAAICIKTITDDGSTIDPNDLGGITYRTIVEIEPKQTMPCCGLPEIVMEKTINALGHEILLKKIHYTYTPFGKVAKEEHYDCNNLLCYSILNDYDAKENLIAKTDPLGHRTIFTYDDNSNLISILGPRNDQHKEITYDKANRPIRIADHQTDGSILITEKKYNKLGQVIAEIDACGNTSFFEYDALGRCTSVTHPDGGVDRREYNVLGFVTKEINPLGQSTSKIYNLKGQPVSVYYPDGTEEHFTYFAHGPIASHTDKNGTKIVYTLDVFDQPIKIQTYSASGKLLRTTTASYSPFCKLSETDGKGITIFYSYDFAGRKIAEQKDYSKRQFSYDSLGRLDKTKEGDIVWIEKHDFLGQVIEKRTESRAELQFQEKYVYDPAGNCIQTINSQGVYSTHFNTYKKPLSTTDPLGFTTHYKYSLTDTLTETVLNPHRIQTIQTYDSKGRNIQLQKKNKHGTIIQQYENTFDLNDQLTDLTHTVFDGSKPISTITHHWDYGPMGRIERILEAQVKQTHYLYDSKGRLQTIIKPNGDRLNHEYDDLGRLARYYSHDFDYHYTYDTDDSLLSVYDSITKTKTRRIYDALNNVVREDMANGLCLFNSFDNYGRRVGITLPDASTITYSYNGTYLDQVQRNENTLIYAERNLEGGLLRSILPKGLGEIIYQKDALGRTKTLVSPFYTSKLSYDAVGNLIKNTFQDSLGKQKINYSFDDLEQLISEDEHTYAFDSLYNRLKKDKFTHEVNTLCQITHDGEIAYVYSPNGNLISDGISKFFYDSQDRLVAVEKDNKRIEYAYDPFQRRLWKKVFINKKRTQYERYLWDGENEIGVVDENGFIQELRILGEGLGAEIGAAVLYEIKGKAFVPIHDVQGSVVTLIDLDSKKLIECYRYTAYGEELTDNHFSPWRFASKRLDETGLIFFGRRYYCPPLGRWITQDPEGFDNDPNLYAYVSNCPLTQIDLYGLQALGLIDVRFNYEINFEKLFLNKCCDYDLSILGKPPLPNNGAIFFINGMLNSFGQAAQSLNYISELSGGYNLQGIYNPTHTALVDPIEAFLNLKGVRTNPVQFCKDQWMKKLGEIPTNMFMLHICHSHGAIYTNLALQDSPDEIRKRIRVLAFAPADYIPEEFCHSVQHYIAPPWRDPIPWISWIARWKNRKNITILPSHPGASLHDHSIQSPTFKRALKRELGLYLDETGKK